MINLRVFVDNSRSIVHSLGVQLTILLVVNYLLKRLAFFQFICTLKWTERESLLKECLNEWVLFEQERLTHVQVEEDMKYSYGSTGIFSCLFHEVYPIGALLLGLVDLFNVLTYTLSAWKCKESAQQLLWHLEEILHVEWIDIKWSY
jgi:hypothetical protein